MEDCRRHSSACVVAQSCFEPGIGRLENGLPGGKCLRVFGADARVDDGRDQDDRPPSGLQDRLDEVGSLTGARVERRLRVWRCFDEYRCALLWTSVLACRWRARSLWGRIRNANVGKGFTVSVEKLSVV